MTEKTRADVPHESIDIERVMTGGPLVPEQAEELAALLRSRVQDGHGSDVTAATASG